MTSAELDSLKKKVLHSLEAERQKLLLRQPFIGLVLMRLDIVPILDSRCPTATTDCKSIYVNCDFYSRLNAYERMFVIAHETWHCILLHAFRKQGRNPERFEYAADLEIQFILQAEGLPVPFMRDYDSSWENLSAEEIYEKISATNGHLSPGKQTKNLFSLENGGFDLHFMGDNLECHDDTDKNNQKKELECEAQKLQSKNPQLSQSQALQQGKDTDFQPVLTDAVKEQIRQITISILQYMEHQGKMSQVMRKNLTILRQSELNWKELLQQFVTKVYAEKRNWLPPSRRHIGQGYFLPSIRTSRLEGILAIDTSGSVYAGVMCFFAEFVGLLNSFGNYELTVIQCDAAINSVEHFSSDRPIHKDYKWEVCGGGGTSFFPPFQYIQEHNLHPNVFIYLTDGYGSAPELPPNYPVLWILTHDGQRPVEWGRCIYLKRPEQGESYE